MRQLSLVAFAVALLPFGAARVDATDINLSGSANLQNIMNGITVGGPSSLDVQADHLADNVDSAWGIANDNAFASIVVEVAGYRRYNSFGIYDLDNPLNSVELFDGRDHLFTPAVELSIGGDGSVFLDSGSGLLDTDVDFGSDDFGFYLRSPDQGGSLFYSDTGLNADGTDHMVALTGNGSDVLRIPGAGQQLFEESDAILAWEDLAGGGDQDFNDMVVFVKGVEPAGGSVTAHTPEPATLALFSVGVAGLAGLARRRKRRSAEA